MKIKSIMVIVSGMLMASVCLGSVANTQTQSPWFQYGKLYLSPEAPDGLGDGYDLEYDHCMQGNLTSTAETNTKFNVIYAVSKSATCTIKICKYTGGCATLVDNQTFIWLGETIRPRITTPLSSGLIIINHKNTGWKYAVTSDTGWDGVDYKTHITFYKRAKSD